MNGFGRVLLVLAGWGVAWGGETVWELKRGEAPVDNPLKGLVPYEGVEEGRFPHSMVFFYQPLGELMAGEGEFRWEVLDRRLDGIAAEGRQAIFRVYLEYPGKRDGIPRYLLDGGLKVRRMEVGDDVAEVPDYEDARLRGALVSFIGALGKRYDGDARIGYLTAGLLGTWGEWHTHPRAEWFASKEVQREVMDAYEGAFLRTPVLLRYPAGDGDGVYAGNSERRLGYHDDSFAWATLDTGRAEDGWFFVRRLKGAGAEEAWRTRPIGGEIRPEAWGRVFDAGVGAPVQDFLRCVEETRVTWLMDTGMFREKAEGERMERAMRGVRRMGYEFFVLRAGISDEVEGVRELRVVVENGGVAPFYQPWKAVFRVEGVADGKVVAEVRSEAGVMGILPGKTAEWVERMAVRGLEAGRYRAMVQVPNVLKGGRPVGFANAEWEADRAGWLTLGEFEVE